MAIIGPSIRDFSLRQLQYVVAVADTLGFRRAAERCAVSQPTLSTQIQHLEEVLGVKLFERDRRKVLVTSAGEVNVPIRSSQKVVVDRRARGSRGRAWACSVPVFVVVFPGDSRRVSARFA